MGLNVSTLGRQIGENRDFRPQVLRGIYNQPIGHNFRTYCVVSQTFSKIGSGTSKNLWLEKRLKLAATLRSSRPGVQSASLIMT